MIDEVELYSHPEFQRRFISDFVSLLNDLQIKRELINSVNLIIATHSPFLLSDVPNENVVRLENGKILDGDAKFKTFCSNIYELLANSFFMEYSMGEVARRHIGCIIDAYNTQEDSKIESIKSRKDFYRYLETVVGDSFLHQTISTMLESMLENEKPDIEKLKNQKERFEQELERVNNQIKIMSEQ